MKKKIFNIVFYFVIVVFSSFLMGSVACKLFNPLLYLFGSIFTISSALLLYHFVTLSEGDFD
jgi:hypothetical protein